MYTTEHPTFSTYSRNVDVALQHDLNFDFPGSVGGFYDFSPLSKTDEDMGAYWASRLIQGHKKMGRQVIIDVGHHGKLSPFETAQRFPDATIIGVEPATIVWNENIIRRYMENGSNSVVAMFQFLVEKLQGHGLEVDRVQVVAPDPWSEPKILSATWKLIQPGGSIIMAIDPYVVSTYYQDHDDKKPDKVAEHLVQAHPQFEAHVDHLTIQEIKEKYGFSDSKYLVRPGHTKIPVLIATREMDIVDEDTGEAKHRNSKLRKFQSKIAGQIPSLLKRFDDIGAFPETKMHTVFQNKSELHADDITLSQLQMTERICRIIDQKRLFPTFAVQYLLTSLLNLVFQRQLAARYQHRESI